MTDFRDLHVPGRPLILVNAWDAASARLVAAAGAAAIGTTSAGVAWSLGAPDGDALPPDGDALPPAAAVAAVERIVAAVAVPVTADVERGYGDVAETVRRISAAGAAGVNIEDGATARPDRIAAARAAAPGLFLNARIDTYLAGAGGLDETVERATAYLAAGADGIFVPGVTDPATVAALVARIDAPVNVMAGPGAPPVGELAALGVARISLGSSVAQAAYGLVARAAAAVLGDGGYAELAGAADYGTLNALFTPGVPGRG
ncbi:isocitrate lyase/PEP mutase family protein [Actinoplanes nipponensis]|uniref:isocitrate lyase/PEP mutase family protein n=1 Tax=Actinoplanes nipponensis TaxID=135950 RepID=UPI0019458617|nr:isocitrate lyase/phosphoenolpyruvate mutase family protein [Actinoplanes nipponensis]